MPFCSIISLHFNKDLLVKDPYTPYKIDGSESNLKTNHMKRQQN